MKLKNGSRPEKSGRLQYGEIAQMFSGTFDRICCVSL
jgi:hypothetical protein